MDENFYFALFLIQVQFISWHIAQGFQSAYSSDPVNGVVFCKKWFLLILSAKLLYIRGSLNKFPDIFRMGSVIDSTHIKL